ncbi:MAG: hypothetical protein R3C18_08320 [Planctomycetaceae bacterium]
MKNYLLIAALASISALYGCGDLVSSVSEEGAYYANDSGDEHVLAMQNGEITIEGTVNGTLYTYVGTYSREDEYIISSGILTMSIGMPTQHYLSGQLTPNGLVFDNVEYVKL